MLAVRPDTLTINKSEILYQMEAGLSDRVTIAAEAGVLAMTVSNVPRPLERNPIVIRADV